MQGLLIAPKIAETSSSALKFIKSEGKEARELAQDIAKRTKMGKTYEYKSPTEPVQDPAELVKHDDFPHIDYFG